MNLIKGFIVIVIISYFHKNFSINSQKALLVFYLKKLIFCFNKNTLVNNHILNYLSSFINEILIILKK